MKWATAFRVSPRGVDASKGQVCHTVKTVERAEAYWMACLSAFLALLVIGAVLYRTVWPIQRASLLIMKQW